MDVVRLGPGDIHYQPDELIEEYSSFIWHEKFQTPGEFELKTPRINKTKALLPIGTLISHLETDEVMVVETLDIEEDDDTYELTVTGRSLTKVFEDRYIEGIHGKKRRLGQLYTPVTVAGLLMFNGIDNSSGKDVTRVDDYDWTILNRIPNIAITDSVIFGGHLPRNWWLVQGGMQDQLQHILEYGDLGIRTIRPPIGGTSGTVLTYKALPLVDRGTPVRTPTDNIMSLRYDLYHGLDRSQAQTDRPQVTFNDLRGDLDKAKYLYSRQNYKTVIEIFAASEFVPSLGTVEVYRSAAARDYFGFDRRVSTLDAGEPQIDDPPDAPEQPDELKQDATESERKARADKMDEWIDDYNKWRTDMTHWRNQRDLITDQFRADSIDDARVELQKSRYISLFTGDISPNILYKYKRHYNLGDTVTLSGRYDQVDNMIVSEHIRTEDAEGDRGYPTLILPDPDVG